MTTDWGIDLAGWEQGAKATAAILDALNKLRDALSRRKKAPRPEVQRELDKEIDALQADLSQIVELLTHDLVHRLEMARAFADFIGPMDAPEGKKNLDKWVNQFTLTTQAVAVLNRAVPNLERRLLALEKQLKVRGKRVPKKKPRRR